ncbi:DUF6436 domain-containing protein [Nitrincola tibetensis]|uniref:DUF6436 domain-containing protein n=1 Tax=Nitrincola tibetensis TaxID=2219697 RepID=UPI0010579A86|nr:DUF6436 domain-containing protein [Nitrincola tibetensis]
MKKLSTGCHWQKIIAYIALLTWLLLMMFSFWWFHFRYLHAASSIEGWVMFQQDHIQLTLDHPTHQPTLVHFFDVDCPCSRFVTADIKQLIDFSAEQAQVKILVPRLDDIPKVHGIFGQQVTVLLAEVKPVAAPAAWLVNTEGETVYLGPYSDSGICRSDSNHLVGEMLADLLLGKEIERYNHLTTGCFCSWPT